MRRAPIPRDLLTLVTFVLGGLIAPSLHQAWHAREWARERTAHLTDGHHAAGTRGTEAAAPCVKPVTVDLRCLLCHGVSVYAQAPPAVALAPAAPARLGVAPRARAAAPPSGFLSARGPPGPVS
jgi:hypothetical protein